MDASLRAGVELLKKYCSLAGEAVTATDCRVRPRGLLGRADIFKGLSDCRSEVGIISEADFAAFMRKATVGCRALGAVSSGTGATVSVRLSWQL